VELDVPASRILEERQAEGDETTLTLVRGINRLDVQAMWLALKVSGCRSSHKIAIAGDDLERAEILVDLIRVLAITERTRLFEQTKIQCICRHISRDMNILPEFEAMRHIEIIPPFHASARLTRPRLGFS
jgi:hypothetical protein